VTTIPFTPADAADHARLGDWYAQNGNLTETQAQYRTALALGLDDPGIMLRLAKAYLQLGQPELASLWCSRLDARAAQYMSSERTALETAAAQAQPVSLRSLDHNRYARMRTLAAVLAEHDAGVRVLDIGGGDGLLALFLPEVEYVLAEPGTNGIVAQELPFAGVEFDIVLSCHVLEHIPAPDRDSFLTTLCDLARRELVLLNPFRPAGTEINASDPWLELVWAITKAPWAKEHLDCGFPSLADVERFATAHGYGCRCEPNGMRAVSTLHVLLSHYANLAQRTPDLEAINELLNNLDPESLDSATMPTAWLVRLDVSA